MSKDPQRLLRECADALALTVGELKAICKTAPKRYFVWQIAKRSGNGTRTVCHPARELKPIQYYFLENLLNTLPIHPSATAYVAGSSIGKNALAHAESRVIMKLDFADFFNSLKVANWLLYAKQHFPQWSEEELDFSSRVLFWGAGSYVPKCLAIGAPTSPLISNALMYEVDVGLANYAKEANLCYTRYADDITFSSCQFLDYKSTMDAVKIILSTAKYTKVILNEQKTVLVSKSSARRVTGLFITPNNKISLGRERKRLICAMLHRSHCNLLASTDWQKLAGLLAFAADVEPTFIRKLADKYPVSTFEKIRLNATIGELLK